MKCCACYSELRDDKSICDICGMQNIKIIGDVDEMAISTIEKLGKDYRQEQLGNVNLSLKAYEYEMNDSGLKEKAFQKVQLTNAVNLVYGKTVWLEKKFASIPTERCMDLDLILDGKNTTYVTVHFHAPQVEDFWYVGIEMKEGFRATIKIGNEQNFVETEEFSIIGHIFLGER